MESRLCKYDFGHLLKSELEHAIEETILSQEDKTIARMYLLEQRKHVEIAAEIYRDRSTVTRRIPGIVARIAKTVERLDFRNFTVFHTPHAKIHPLVWGFCYHVVKRMIR